MNGIVNNIKPNTSYKNKNTKKIFKINILKIKLRNCLYISYTIKNKIIHNVLKNHQI